MKKHINAQAFGAIKTICGIAVLLCLVGIGIKLSPIVISLLRDDGAFRDKISSMGVGGWLCVLGIQVLQVIIAVIPGEPVEIVSGLLYGPLGGFVLCEIGIFVGSAAIFFGVRFFGYSLVASFISEEKLAKYKFLHDAKALELLVFILFFIPGTPKDILTYMVGFTPIKPLRFLLIATLARIPSVFTSTLAGHSLTQGNLLISALIFAASGVIALAGILIHRKLMTKIEK